MTNTQTIKKIRNLRIFSTNNFTVKLTLLIMKNKQISKMKI